MTRRFQWSMCQNRIHQKCDKKWYTSPNNTVFQPGPVILQTVVQKRNGEYWDGNASKCLHGNECPSNCDCTAYVLWSLNYFTLWKLATQTPMDRELCTVDTRLHLILISVGLPATVKIKFKIFHIQQKCWIFLERLYFYDVLFQLLVKIMISFSI